MLFAILVILLITLMLLTKKIDDNYANPFFVSVAVFLVGCFVVLANLRRWEFVLQKKVFFVILFFMIAFWLGCMIPLKTCLSKSMVHTTNIGIGGIPDIKPSSSFMVIAFFIIQISCLVLYVLFYYKTLFIDWNDVSAVRDTMLDAEYPGYIGHLYLISRTIAMVYCYQFIYFWIKKVKKVKLLIPIIPYLILEIATTGRSGFIYFFGYAIVIYCMLIKQLVNDLRHVSRIVRNRILKIGATVLIVFILLGNLTGKTQYMGVYDMLSMYIGAPICNIQYYFDNASMYISPRFGAYTQPFLSSIFDVLGYKKYTGTLYYPFVKYADTLGRTNIYTTIVKPIIDYGVIGAIIFIFICGIIIGCLYKRAKEKSCSSRRLIIFGYFMMPLFCFGLEYQIGNFWFATRMVYTLIYILIVDYIINYYRIEIK